jgi:hypothetical protein
MTDESEVLAAIRKNAELVISVAQSELGKAIAYDEAGVEWLDGFIQRQHEQGNSQTRNGLVQTLGSYLGECIVRTFGGEWTIVDDTWAIRFDDQNAAFPFAKVAKQLENGVDDSVLSFFRTIPIVFRQK